MYARMSDDELSRVQRENLADLPRKFFDQEVSRRGLQINALDPPDPPPPGSMVCVASFAYPDEARMARALLESASIPVFLENEHILSLNQWLTNAIGGLHLMVPAACAEDARQVLDSKVSDQELDAQAEAAPKPPED